MKLSTPHLVKGDHGGADQHAFNGLCLREIRATSQEMR